mmetsp:Transcript_46528/g.54366  ORF Transcript_46528/g.54366 Transcript_46528/m.54366 type:complete len:224 (+) Transcript_46528:1970-2641(+)
MDVGEIEGKKEGKRVGDAEGIRDGTSVGDAFGDPEGSLLGTSVGVAVVGREVGTPLGTSLASIVGETVGSGVGSSVLLYSTAFNTCMHASYKYSFCASHFSGFTSVSHTCVKFPSAPAISRNPPTQHVSWLAVVQPLHALFKKERVKARGMSSRLTPPMKYPSDMRSAKVEYSLRPIWESPSRSEETMWAKQESISTSPPTPKSFCCSCPSDSASAWSFSWRL